MFYDILKGKNTFLGYKNKKSKKWKKLTFFQFFFVRKYRPGKCLLRYSRAKKRFLGYKKKKIKRSKNWHFCKLVNPWFWSKNGHFSDIFFLGNICQKNVFYDMIQRKKAFLGYKNKKIKRSKNWHFAKGVNPWFWSKNGHFSNFHFLSNIGQENVFYDILERKNAFLGYKNKKFKKSKNWHFSKGVNAWFWSKNDRFSNFYFLGNMGQENFFYKILERKNACLGCKKKKFKESKNCYFSKGFNPWLWSENGPFSSFFFLNNIAQENIF